MSHIHCTAVSQRGGHIVPGRTRDPVSFGRTVVWSVIVSSQLPQVRVNLNLSEVAIGLVFVERPSFVYSSCTSLLWRTILVALSCFQESKNHSLSGLERGSTVCKTCWLFSLCILYHI